MSRERASFGRIILILSLVCLLSVLTSIGSSAQTVIPVVTANNEPAVVEVDVEDAEGANTTITYPGYIECNTGSQSQVTVNLQVTTGGWNCSIDPDSMTFFAGGETRQNYTVTVSVPNNSSGGDNRTSKVGGSWTGSGALVGDVNEDSTLIRIKQHYRFEISVEHPEAKEAEMVANISVVVSNTGNGRDEFRIEFSDSEELGADGWGLAGPIEIEVDQGEEETAYMEITVTKWSGSYELNLTVTSIGSEDVNGTDTVSVSEVFTIKVIGGSDPPDDGDDDDDGIPFISPAELIGIFLLVAIVGRFRGKKP